MILGIDIGTSACKVSVFDKSGKILADATEGYKVYYPKAGWAEQNPEEWYTAICLAVKTVLKTVSSDEITAIGIDGQGWSSIAVDENLNVLCPNPIWFDTRALSECRELRERIGEEEIFRLSGNPIQPSYCTPKELWIKKNLPDVYAKTAYFLQSNSYIAAKLTGNLVTDKSMGYGYYFYDIEKCCYNYDMLEKIGLNPKHYPPICDSSDIVGEVTERAAAETGLKVGTRVVIGGLDAACGTLGAGVYKIGQTQEQGGQAGGMSICVDSPTSDIRLILGNHVVPGLWLLQGGTVAGGASMQWFKEELGSAFSEKNVFAEIDKAAKEVSAGSDGMIFLPYLNGERSPIWDPDAKGVYYGISFSKTKAHFARATMEGVAYSLLHNLKIAEDAGATAGELYSMGGSSKSELWMQIKSDVTGKTMCASDVSEASSLGAAILAGIGTGIYKSFDEAVSLTVKIKKKYYPNKDNEKIYSEAYKKYLEIYQNLKEVMKS